VRKTQSEHNSQGAKITLRYKKVAHGAQTFHSGCFARYSNKSIDLVSKNFDTETAILAQLVDLWTKQK
jgi:hypothetical protein